MSLTFRKSHPGLILALFTILWSLPGWLPENASAVSLKPSLNTASLQPGYGSLPLTFEPNLGQSAGPVKFLSHGDGYALFLTSNEVVLRLSHPGLNQADKSYPRARQAGRPALVTSRSILGASSRTRDRSAVLRLKLLGSRRNPVITGSEELPGKSSYFIGRDPEKWRTNIPNYARVHYGDIYPGIDLVYYGKGKQLEHDFVVHPGADPRAIRLGLNGLAPGSKLHLTQHGDLALPTTGGEVILVKPTIYQQLNGVKRFIEGGYVLSPVTRRHSPGASHQVGFRVAAYNRRLPLVIDPVLAYSTYLGGTDSDRGFGIAVDSFGSAYVTGWTQSMDFPTAYPVQPDNGGNGLLGSSYNAFVTKLNPAGTALVYSTYLGGSGDTEGHGIAVDSSGSAYIAGFTHSTDFPTANALQPAPGGGYDDVFITKLSPSGTALLYSTYLGGDAGDEAYGVAVDPSGSACVTGYTQSSDFPTVNAIQTAPAGNLDAFVARINPAGSALVYSTYLGGSNTDIGRAIAVDISGNAYVTGNTTSTNFRRMNALQPIYGGGATDGDAFVTKFNPTGGLVYSTYLGGTYDDDGYGIAVDLAGSAYITGRTYSLNDFPRANAFQPTYGDSSLTNSVGDGFVTKLSPSGTSLVYSTYLGGNLEDVAYAIAVDSSGSAYITGETNSTNFPTAGATQLPRGQGGVIFVTRFAPAGSPLLYSTYLGGNAGEEGHGIAVDSSGSAYITGYTQSSAFPTVKPLQPGKLGFQDAFVAKIASANWQVLDISSANDSKARFLWSNVNGSIILWSVDNAGNYTFGPLYGPYPGFDVRAVAAGSDGLTRVLWNRTDGGAVLWLVGQAPPYDNVYEASFGYGPFPGWTAVDVAASSDGQTRMLWSRNDGTMEVWNIDNAFRPTYGPVYGPYSGWTPRAIAAGGSDRLTRVLWNRTDGTAAVWLMGQQAPYNNTYETSASYGPYSGWTAEDITVAIDNRARLLWANVDGRVNVWSVDNALNPVYGPAYGPYPGFTPARIAAGGDGYTRMLWYNTNGSAILWFLNGSNVYLASYQYGPY